MQAPALPRSPIVEGALRIAGALRDAGHIAYFAGGCVRDLLLGRPPKDIDIATDAPPDAVLALFPHTRQFGKAFAVVQVSIGDHAYEVATFRRDEEYRDGRHPERVAFSTPEQDAQRRDFTINGLFYDPVAARVIDFVDGQRDLEGRVLRAIGDPAQRFREDYLRMLRAVRFAATLEFDIEPQTAAAIREHAAALGRISAERIQQELTRLLTESPRAGRGIELLRDTGLLDVILPEIAALQGVAQPPEFHPEGDVFRHTVTMLDLMRHPSPELAYAVLLHDVGKPATQRVTTDAQGRERIRFDGHAPAGADLAVAILKRLRASNDLVDTVAHCVRDHMRFLEIQKMRTSKLRALVAAPTFKVELELHRLDCLASHGKLDNHAFLVRFVESLRNEPRLPAPWISGRDIMELGIAEGPEVGRWRQRAFEAQLEGRAASREELLAWLRREISEAAKPPDRDGGASR